MPDTSNRFSWGSPTMAPARVGPRTGLGANHQGYGIWVRLLEMKAYMRQTKFKESACRSWHRDEGQRQRKGVFLGHGSL